jgi:hypothetical protein
VSKKKQQTIAKRNRERAIEEKRRLKRERKQAQREAIRNGEPWPAPDADVDEELRPNLNAPDLPAAPVAVDETT